MRDFARLALDGGCGGRVKPRHGHKRRSRAPQLAVIVSPEVERWPVVGDGELLSRRRDFGRLRALHNSAILVHDPAIASVEKH